MGSITRILGIAAVIAVALGAQFGGAAAEQAWPTKLMRAIVPLTPGSGADVVGRVVMEVVSRQIGQPIVFENRAGGGNLIGMTAVAKSEPDGYTILVNSSTHTVTTAIREAMPIDTVTDLSPITPLGSLPLVLIAKKDHKTMADLVAYGKANPDKMSYSSAGAGNQSHLSAEMFRTAAGFEALHVPYKGANDTLTEVVAGRVDYYMCPVNAALEIIRDGQVQALAVTGSARLPALPNVPTFEELGFSKPIYGSWIGVFVPGRTPAPIKARLYSEITRALDNPDVAKKLEAIAIGPMKMTSEQFDKLIRAEIETYTGIATAANIRVK